MATKVCIIGRGLAGCMAAISSVKHSAETTLVYRGLGCSALSSGLLALAASRSEVPLSRAQQTLLKHRPHHPYSLFEDPLRTLKDSVDTFNEFFPGIYRQLEDTEQSAGIYPNDLGTFTRANLAPNSFWEYNTDSKLVQVAAISGYPLFRSSFLEKAFNKFQPSTHGKVEFKTLTIDFLKDGQIFKNSADLARYLDHDENIEKLCTCIKKADLQTDGACLLMPAVLGFNRFDVAKKLSETLGLDVMEVTPTQNSIPGLKLSRFILDRLESSGVKLVNADVIGYTSENNSVTSIEIKRTDGKHDTIEGDSFVLASGKFIGGGIVCKNKDYREPIFNSSVNLGAKKLEDVFIGRLTDTSFNANQLFAQAGIKINSSCHIVNTYNSELFSNLFAAGQILGGFDPFTDGCSQGVDIVTGHMAGKQAAEVRS